MPDTQYMILHDSQRKGREIFIGLGTNPQHRYVDSGVQRLAKITACPGGWGKFKHAVKVRGLIWVSFSERRDMLDYVWYPLQPYDETALTADYLRNQAINKETRDRLRDEGRR